MAQNAVGGLDLSFTYANRVNAIGNSGGFISSAANYFSINGLRNRLQAFDPFTYTNSVLDTMCVNDMVFALRNIDDPSTISSNLSAQTARTS